MLTSLKKLLYITFQYFIFKGIWKGQRAPNLNNDRRFLRGGKDSEVLDVEEDSIGKHNHGYLDKYYGGNYNKYCPTKSKAYKTPEGVWNVDAEKDWICRESQATGYIGTKETRPKNMKVIFIIRVF